MTANILFSGIGCQERGFINSGCFDFEVINTSEINKEAVLSYAAIHCGLTNDLINSYNEYPTKKEMAQYLTDINLGYEPDKNKYYNWFKFVNSKKNTLEKYWLACKLSHNLGDISKIDKLPYADFWTCSFPCQSISVAGKMKGLKPDSGTRSSLLWENIRLLLKAKEDNTLPKYVMFENVKNLVGKKFIADFNDLLTVLNDIGFNTYWKVINGKYCGVPQNRERVFAISIRKDIDTGLYKFPTPFESNIKLKDILQDKVDEKYYINNEKAQTLIQTLIDNGTLPDRIFNRTEQNRTEQNRTEQNRTEQNRTEQNRTDCVLTGQLIIQKNEKLQTAFRQEQTEEFQTDVMKEPWSLNNKFIGKPIDTAICLLARDYKGFGNLQLGNGVIECVKKD